MKPISTLGRMAIIAGLCAWAGLGHAQQISGHYPAGAEGIKAASLPPPGIYLRDYNFFYWADKNKNGPPDFDFFAYINAPRVIWMTDCTVPFLGAQYGMDLIVPFYYSNIKFNTPGGRVKDDTFALDDIQFEPLLLSWHFKQFDVAAGYAFWAPSGDSNTDGTRPSRLGKGFWGNMFTAGATWYPDESKRWAASVLNRYEINTQNEDLEITPGDQYTVEWGLSYTVKKNIDIGLVGYYQQQVTDDSGPGVSALGFNRDLHDHVVALGPEISVFCPKLAIFASLRYEREFAAKDRPEGNLVVLTLTKRF